MCTQEFKFINLLLSKAKNLTKGIGDDAFVYKKNLIAADMFIENTHFRLDWNTPEQAVEKCLLANFSDINAMGGKSVAILFSVCMNKKWSATTRQKIAIAVADICKKHKVKILGGDTTGGDLGVFSITVFGKAKHKILLRSAASVGDDVWLSNLPGKNAASSFKLVPTPPLKLGEQLAKIKGIGACIDLSDTLAESLEHISNNSKVHIEIEKYLSDSELNSAEDYELLFTANKTARKQIENLAYRIGTVKKGSGIFLAGKKIKVKGWRHF